MINILNRVKILPKKSFSSNQKSNTIIIYIKRFEKSVKAVSFAKPSIIDNIYNRPIFTGNKPALIINELMKIEEELIYTANSSENGSDLFIKSKNYNSNYLSGLFRTEIFIINFKI